MKSTAKAFAQARQLKDALSLRLKLSASINSVREDKNAAGEPVLILSKNGNEAAGQAVVGICIRPANAVSKDVFGRELFAYTPHIIEIATEEDAPVTHLDLLAIQLELAKVGMKESVKVIAEGTAVTAATIAAASEVASFEYEVQWPAKGI